MGPSIGMKLIEGIDGDPWMPSTGEIENLKFIIMIMKHMTS